MVDLGVAFISVGIVLSKYQVKIREKLSFLSEEEIKETEWKVF